jgi:hypothetical protein
MATRKISAETFRKDLSQLVEALNEETVATLGNAREVQLAARVLMEAEAVRLAAKLGAEAPRVQALKAAAAARVEVAQALDVEVQIASVRVPRVAQTDTLLHGRITDQSLTRVAGVAVQLVDAGGKPVAGVPAVQTDAQGYYAFVLKPEQAAALAKEKLAVTIAGSGQSVQPAQAPLTLQPGATLTHEIQLTDDELARLKLRAPGAADLGLRRGVGAKRTARKPKAQTKSKKAPRGKGKGK